MICRQLTKTETRFQKSSYRLKPASLVTHPLASAALAAPTMPAANLAAMQRTAGPAVTAWTAAASLHAKHRGSASRLTSAWMVNTARSTSGGLLAILSVRPTAVRLAATRPRLAPWSKSLTATKRPVRKCWCRPARRTVSTISASCFAMKTATV